jgi:surface protein
MKSKTKTIAVDKFDLAGHINEAIKLNGEKCSLNHIDTSQITDMSNLFYCSSFNGDISEWDTSKVRNMFHMFEQSEFNGDISRWNTTNVKNMEGMFCSSNFMGNILKWDISNVEDMSFMFYLSNFNGDLSAWKPLKVMEMGQMFGNCDAPIPYWYNFGNKKARGKAIKSYCLHNELGEELDVNETVEKKKIKL